jgi:membrane protein implicated in regulation of membrane protease activity
MDTSIFSRPEIIWFLGGLILFLLELVIPGFFIFFFAVGAWVAALTCLIWNPGTNLQIIIFAVTSLLSLLALRRVIQKKFLYSQQNNDDSDAVEDEFTGKVGIALTSFAPGQTGRVEFKGTTWSAESQSVISEGQSVIIISKESFTLTVKPKNN